MPTTRWMNLDAAGRACVLQAATAEFAKMGYAGGSLDVIAREAGIAKASLLLYFDDQLDLFVHVCDVVSQRVRDHMVMTVAGYADAVDFFGTMDAAVADWTQYLRDHPLDRGITHAANFELDADVRAAVRAVTNRPYIELLTPVVSRASDRAELRADTKPDSLVALLVLLLPHLALAPFVADLDPVLGMSGLDRQALTVPVRGLLGTLERAFSSTTAEQIA